MDGEGEYKSREEVFADPVKMREYWLKAIRFAGEEEKEWRDKAQKAVDLYEIETESDFNILHSNVETIVPAIYNSLPVPDCRTRHNDRNEIARRGAAVLERGLAYQIDMYDFDDEMRQIAYDFAIVGRGVPWIKYDPWLKEVPGEADPYTGEMGEPQQQLIWQQIGCERVPWDRYRHGPGSSWKQVPWVARLRFMTREELEQLAGPETAKMVTLDAAQYSVSKGSENKAEKEKTVWQCAGVWEIWDKDTRNVFYIADGYSQGPIAIIDDPLALVGFFPCPRPAQVLRKRKSLTPIVPYTTYSAQAEELRSVSERIAKLTAMLKYRGIRASEVAELDRIEELEDGEFTPSKEAMALLQNRGALENAIWVMPIDKVIQVVRELVTMREEIKQTIFELSGMSDIIRGQSDARETLGAQQIKAQWGSLRLQNQQAEIQRICRDIFRMKAELIAEKFEPFVLNMIAGEKIPPPVLKTIKSDVLRAYAIDIETDSTIRADLARVQQNMSQFLQATAQYLQVAGPAVQSGMLPAGAAVAIFSAFARTFKLGKQVEDELAKLGEGSEQFGQQKMQEQQQAKQVQQQGAQLEQAERVVDIRKKQTEVEGQQIENAAVAAGIQPGPGFIAG